MVLHAQLWICSHTSIISTHNAIGKGTGQTSRRSRSTNMFTSLGSLCCFSWTYKEKGNANLSNKTRQKPNHRIFCWIQRLTLIQTGVVNRLLRSLEIFWVFIFMYCAKEHNIQSLTLPDQLLKKCTKEKRIKLFQITNSRVSEYVSDYAPMAQEIDPSHVNCALAA